MANLWIWMAILVATTVTAFPDRTPRYPFPFVTRAGWNARAATSTTPLATPVSLVIIRHTVTRACTTRADCSALMRSMQNYHMNTHGWPDIGYNFVIGGDGATYEGRGWSILGTHTAGWNAQSIGIGLIGNFLCDKPPTSMLNLVRRLIAEGIRRGFIASNYIVAHRPVSPSECSKATLFGI